MRRAMLFGTALAVWFCLSGLPLMAQSRTGGGMGSGGGMGQSGGQGQGGGQGQPGGPGMGQGPSENGPMGPQAGGNNRTSGPTMTQKTPSQMLAQNPTLTSKVQDLLPSGTNPQDAASGFKDLDKFVAAVHLSHNLNIPFDQLKGKVTTGASLDKAVQTLNPNLSHQQIKTEVKKGKHQAKADIKASRKS
ncbi:MAG TPA: hypothetical protein VFZ27_15520 [Terriglobia bacterium]|nr:hypothetical protein [Terriglobia bacterium]